MELLQIGKTSLNFALIQVQGIQMILTTIVWYCTYIYTIPKKCMLMYKMYCIVCYYALAPLQAKSGRCQFERTITTILVVQAPHHHDHQLHHHKQEN